MLHGKGYCAVNAVFQFLASFLDRSMGCLDNPVLTPKHTLYFDIVYTLLLKTCALNAHGKLVSYVQEKIDLSERKAKNVFGDLEYVNLFTQKFHMLNLIVEDVSPYEDVNLVDVSAFEYFYSVVKNIYSNEVHTNEMHFGGDRQNYQLT